MISVRENFPILDEWVSGHRLCYLDTAASALKPRVVVERIAKFDLFETSNVHRGAHYLSQQATQLYEDARHNVATFLNAKEDGEIVFTRNTTEAINLVAQTMAASWLNFGDEIWLTEMEHHSNIVPWQLAAERSGAKIIVVPVLENGELDLDFIDKNLSERAKVFSLVYVSNSLGTENPVTSLVKKVKKFGVKVVVDAAQAVTCQRVDVQNLGCDFLAFSGHKMFGPFGIGVLWAQKRWLELLPVYQGGGSMISEVSFEKTTYLPPPNKFEAGTPNVSGAIGLSAALDFFRRLPIEEVRSHERQLLMKATDELSRIEGFRVVGTSDTKVNILSFLLGEHHPSDVGQILDQQGVAVRTGHHCCMPLMKRFGISGTVRASFSIYNNEEDVESLVRAVRKAKELLS